MNEIGFLKDVSKSSIYVDFGETNEVDKAIGKLKAFRFKRLSKEFYKTTKELKDQAVEIVCKRYAKMENEDHTPPDYTGRKFGRYYQFLQKRWNEQFYLVF